MTGGGESRRRVTLSFDNGPDPGGTTDAVLEVLGARGVKATFFVIGQQLQQPGAFDVVRRAAETGHWIGNHTLSHSVMFGDSDDPDLPAREIGAVDAQLGAFAHADRFFRPFAGGGLLGPRLLSRAAVSYLEAHQHTLVLWNSVPRDWEDGPDWVDRCLEDVRRQDWTLVVLHDVPAGGTRYLPRLLDALEALDADVVQALPGSCVPLHRGRATAPLTGLMSV